MRDTRRRLWLLVIALGASIALHLIGLVLAWMPYELGGAKALLLDVLGESMLPGFLLARLFFSPYPHTPTWIVAVLLLDTLFYAIVFWLLLRWLVRRRARKGASSPP